MNWTLVLCLFIFGGLLTFLIGLTNVFSKAGYTAWFAVIPFYNYYIMVKIADHQSMWFF